MEFPPREENIVPLFTPPQTQPISYPAAEDEALAVQASLQSDNSEMRYCVNRTSHSIGFLSCKLHFHSCYLQHLLSLSVFRRLVAWGVGEEFIVPVSLNMIGVLIPVKF